MSHKINHESKRSLTMYADRLEALLRQEDDYEVKDYLSSTNVVNEECRRCMALWTYQMVEFCHFNVETASVALNYLDRFLSSKHGDVILSDKREFQLSSMCALMMAVKLSESVKLDVKLLSELSKGCFHEQEIIDMEMNMLFGLQWRLCPTTAFDFLEIYLGLMTMTLTDCNHKVIETIARRQIEHASKHYYFSTHKPSNIALASLINAIDALNISHDHLIGQLIQQINITETVREVQTKLQTSLQSLPQLNQTNIKKKKCFSNNQYRATSTNAPVSPTSVRNWTC